MIKKLNPFIARGIYEDDDEFVYGYPIYSPENGWEMFVKWESLERCPGLKTDLVTLTKEPDRCTGLKDKNGEWIWENDILKIYDGRLIITCQKRTAIVEFDQKLGAFYANSTFLPDYLWEYKCEITGNTHFNPELHEEWHYEK
jgi:hypothetical protein